VYLEGYEELDMVDEWSFAVDVDESEGVQMQGLAHDGMVIGPMVEQFENAGIAIRFT
jgi:hypothetical protein